MTDKLIVAAQVVVLWLVLWLTVREVWARWDARKQKKPVSGAAARRSEVERRLAEARAVAPARGSLGMPRVEVLPAKAQQKRSGGREPAPTLWDHVLED
jgi:hypothetical protein